MPMAREKPSSPTLSTPTPVCAPHAIRAQTYSGLMGPAGNLISNIGFAVVAVAGAVDGRSRGMATVGTVVAFLSYAQQLRRPVNDVSSLFNTIQAALAGAERVFAIIDEAPEPGDAQRHGAGDDRRQGRL